MIIRVVVLLIIFFNSLPSLAQSNLLDEYINQALESNLALRQKQYSYQKSLEALKEAKRMYLPIVSIDARYTLAEGGRTVIIPFGDLMNPAYENLNAVNQNLNIPVPQYPEIDNEVLSFIRSSEQETKLVASIPVFNAAIVQNHKIKKGLSEVEKINVEIYKRELVKEVKEAYVKYLQAGQILLVYKNTLQVVEQQLKNRQSLFTNNKITMDEVYAARAQVKEVEKNLAEANKNKVMASSWFNFLLNRDFSAQIETRKVDDPIISTYYLDDLKSASVLKREEFDQLDKYLEIQQDKINYEKGAALPKVFIGAQYGYQGTDYTFNNESDLAMAGFSMKWDLFTSGQRQSKIKQAQMDQQILENRRQEIKRQVQMEVTDAYYSLQTAQKGIELAKQEVQNYQKSYSLVEKKYELGSANFLEYSGALNNKLNAENKLIMAQYAFQLEQIRIERLIAAYQF